MNDREPDVKVVMGTKAKCEYCGEEIEYVGSYWRHTQFSPRHIALPKQGTFDYSRFEKREGE